MRRQATLSRIEPASRLDVHVVLELSDALSQADAGLRQAQPCAAAAAELRPAHGGATLSCQAQSDPFLSFLLLLRIELLPHAVHVHDFVVNR